MLDFQLSEMTTKVALLITAERLFSEQSIDSVSLRQIAVEAGQKNTSALHYHFGSKEGLISAIFDYRQPALNQQRFDSIDRLEKENRLHDLRGLVQVLIDPLADQLKPGGASHYVGFLESLISASGVANKRQLHSKNDQGQIRVTQLIKEILADVPTDLANLRIGLMIEQMILYLNEWRRITMERGQAKIIHQLDYYVANMVEMFVATLAAPAPAETSQQVPARE